MSGSDEKRKESDQEAEETALRIFPNIAGSGYATPIEDASTVLLRLTNGAHGIVDTYSIFMMQQLKCVGTSWLQGSLIAQGTIGQEPWGRCSEFLIDRGYIRLGQPAAPDRSEKGFGSKWRHLWSDALRVQPGFNRCSAGSRYHQARHLL